MWIFLPDAFYSLRAYDSNQGGAPVREPHVVVRARVGADIEKVRITSPHSFDLPHGTDYRYHLAVPEAEWINFLAQQTRNLSGLTPMKAYDNPRIGVHEQVWIATLDLEDANTAK